MNDVTIGLTAPGAEESQWLAIDQDMARTILGLMAIAWDEGLGADGDDELLATIKQVFPNLEIPEILR